MFFLWLTSSRVLYICISVHDKGIHFEVLSHDIRASNHMDLSVFLRIYTYKYGLQKFIQFIWKFIQFIRKYSKLIEQL